MDRDNVCENSMKNADISKYLEIFPGCIIAFVGCGGKTSLIELIAAMNTDKKVLITPTTKTFPIASDGVTLCDTLQSCVEHIPKTGIQCFGQLNKRNGKLEALPEKVLADIIPKYDIVLLEADGSRWLPCKGWCENEPVVPDFCTHTVGVVTMNALNMEATHNVVHHLPEFLSMTGLREGDMITMQTIEDMVCLPKGMFKNSTGKQYLLVNQVEDDETEINAKRFLENIKINYPERFKKLIYGSVHRNSWYEE